MKKTRMIVSLVLVLVGVSVSIYGIIGYHKTMKEIKALSEQTREANDSEN